MVLRYNILNYSCPKNEKKITQYIHMRTILLILARKMNYYQSKPSFTSLGKRCSLMGALLKYSLKINWISKIVFFLRRNLDQTLNLWPLVCETPCREFLLCIPFLPSKGIFVFIRIISVIRKHFKYNSDKVRNKNINGNL